MKKFASSLLCLAACALPFAAYSQQVMTPGLYEYSMKVSMPGGPGMPPQTSQHCVTGKEGTKAYEMPQQPNTDCKVTDRSESGGQFTYKVSCTKPQKMESNVKGSFTATSMAMDMTTTMPGMPGPMTQNITAKRIGDCK